MCCRTSNSASTGFTLLEVMTATMIMALLSFTLFRFVSTQLYAIHTSQVTVEDRESLMSVARFLQGQLADLPPRGDNLLLGEVNKFRGQPSDEITWLCGSGEGVLTS